MREKESEIDLPPPEIAAQNDLLASAFVHAAIGIALISPSGRWLKVNHALHRWLGYSEEKLLSRTLQEITHPGDRSFLPEMLRGNRESYQLEQRYLHETGRVLWASLSVAVARDEQGQPVHFICHFQDITESKHKATEWDHFFQVSLDMLAVVGFDGYLRQVNPAWTRILGWSEAELLGRPVLDLAHPEDREGIVAARRALAAGQPLLLLENRYQCKDGTYRWLSWRSFALPEQRTVFAIARDITERKEAEQRIREQADLLDRASEAIVIADLDENITFWNHGAELLFGYAAEEMLGRPFSDALGTAVTLDAKNTFQAISSAADWRGELNGHDQDGRPMVIEASATMIRNEAGEARARLMICSNITERKNLQEQFLRAQRLENLGMLAAGIAHDLNNVLAPIRMFAPLLRSGLTGTELNEFLDILEKSAARGADLVRQILTFAHGAAGEPKQMDIKHLVKDIARIVRATFPKSIVVEEHIARDLWPARANPTQIHQVLLNLCINARDAMTSGKIRLSARNRTLDAEAAAEIGCAAGNWLLIEVEDTGTGIEPDILDRIWEPFFTTKSPNKGTGLGLSTARGIVESRGGTITVESQPGRGTCFSIYLSASEAAKESTPEDSTELRKGHGELILLVDDEKSIRDLAKAILIHGGYRVITAEDGAKARMRFLNSPRPISLVITDMDMPKMNGLDLARDIIEVNPRMKILATSGFTETSPSKVPPQFGDSFLAKPFTAEALLHRVQELLHRQ